jgi:flavorubredoxin
VNVKNTWHPVDGHPEIFYGHYIVPNFMSNSIAVQVAEHEWLLISPGEPMLKDWQERFAKPDTKISIIFPNHYHHLGVNAWLEHYPDAALYASQRAVDALIGKGFAHVTDLEYEQPALPAGYSVLIPPGHRGGDVWLAKQDAAHGSVWITCDSFMNYARLSNQPVARMMQRAMKTAPGLKISHFVKYLLIDNKRDFKQWALIQLEQDQPTTLIPSHGVVEQGEDLPKRLQALLEERM